MTIFNAFSVDLEDWYQAITSLMAQPEKWHTFEPRVVANTHRLLKLFAEYGIRATFFVLGQVALDHPNLIQEIEAKGHEIGIHGHRHKMVNRLSPAEFAREIDDACHAIAPLVKQPILGHRAPYFSIDNRSRWALDVLREKGFQYDSSFFPTKNPLYGSPKTPRFPYHTQGVAEFPLATARWGGVNWPIAGGLYLRALPYALVRAGIRQLNQQGYPAVIYLHPWELDTTHRYNAITLREHLVQYTRRGSLEGKLRKLFTEFEFRPLCEFLT